MQTEIRQRGAALLVSLMMLIILTLLGLSAVNMSTINFKIVGNRQASMEASMRTQNAIEAVLSDVDNFINPTANPTVDGTVQTTAAVNGVAIGARRCYARQTAPGYSLTWGLAPQDTNWEVVASYADAATGANTTIRQGVKIRMTSGNCP